MDLMIRDPLLNFIFLHPNLGPSVEWTNVFRIKGVDTIPKETSLFLDYKNRSMDCESFGVFNTIDFIIVTIIIC